jgi:hypothetical protein
VNRFQIFRPGDVAGRDRPVPDAHPPGVERELETGVVRRAALLRAIPLGDGGREQEPGDGDRSREDEEQEEPLVQRAGRRERAPSRSRRSRWRPPTRDRDGGRAALSEAERGPRDEREDRVVERIAPSPAGERTDEDDRAGREETEPEDAGLRPPSHRDAPGHARPT